MEDLVSVIVPIHNAERFLEECIQSILTQTYKNIELLLINDGSTDGSSLICRHYEALDERVSLIEQEQHGVSFSRNVGIEKGKGKYLCFIDADDFIAPNYIQELHETILEEKVDVVFCNYKLLYGNRRLPKSARIESGKYLFADIANVVIDDGTATGILFGSVCTAMYSVELIRKNEVFFDETILRNEDGLFNLCLLQKATSFYVTDYNGYQYRQWKNKKIKQLEWDTELDKATEAIQRYCKGIGNSKEQLHRRNISVFLGNALRAGEVQKNIWETSTMLCRYLEQHPIGESLQYLDWQRMNRAKRVLINLLAKKQVWKFVFIVKYVYPWFKRIAKR